MDEQLAAAFVSLSPGQLRAGVQRGEFPKPLRIGRRVLYHRDAMSRAINARAGIQDHHAEIEETGWEL
ncbi:hypothetical protein CKO24_05420 [Rhodothalassium salexigens DSM 2132]|nr:hypothetical protein [Rhodothalassium salexigens DSM 2132]